MRSELGVSLAYGLLASLGQSIVRGEFEKTGFPTEAELCVRYGASRTVMREAVKMLSAKGLLSSRQRQGTRVEPVENWNLLDPDVLRWLMERPFSNKIFLEFTQMRLAIEPTAAALAAEVQDRRAIAAIREGLEAMISTAEGVARYRGLKRHRDAFRHVKQLEWGAALDQSLEAPIESPGVTPIMVSGLPSLPMASIFPSQIPISAFTMPQ